MKRADSRLEVSSCFLCELVGKKVLLSVLFSLPSISSILQVNSIREL
jgi:hypothetical protein